jgi:CheY-like chemotaxis protein
VLIVDDNDDTRELYGWCMRAAGWFVGGAANGAEALLVAPAFEPDVIVMDLNMPVLGGIEAIRRLKSDEDTMHVPIVALTAYDLDGNRAAARGAGCDEFVTKPCEPDDLRALLETMVKSRE